MLDINILRNDPDIIKNAVKVKSIDGVNVDDIAELDAQRVKLQQKLDNLRKEKNEISDKMKSGKPDEQLISKAKEIKEEIQSIEKEFNEYEDKFWIEYKKLPNIPAEDVPVGYSEDENVVEFERSDKVDFAFEPKNHAQIAEVHGWIDKERAAKLAGSRFAYLKGDLVRLQYALVQWVMDTLSDSKVIEQIIANEGLDLPHTPFELVLPPLMLKTEVYDAMDRLEPRDDRYKIEGEDLWLQGSAEHVVGSMHRGEILEEEELPKRYLAYATSFRKEAGTYGKDMEGIIRMHQFDKLEMESFTTEEMGADEHKLFIAIQEYLMQQLEIPYQRLKKCTYDIGKPNVSGSDIEAWLPGQGKYRETHTADYMGDFQARRLMTRYRNENGEVKPVMMNDGTAFALGRILVAILENYQTKESNVVIPKVLREYMGGVNKIGKEIW